MPSSHAHPRWLRTVQVVSLTQIAILIGFNFSYPFLPLFIQELGVTDRSELELWSGIVIGGGGITMAFASPVWGLLADRLGRKTMLVRSIVAGSLVLALQATVTTVWQLAAIRSLQGAFTGAQAAAAMLLAGVVPRERTGLAFGLLNTAVQVGNLIGPVLGGFAVLAIGFRGSFLVGAALLAVCTVVTVVLVEDTPTRASGSARPGVVGSFHDIFAPFAWPSLRGVLVIGAIIALAYAGTVPLVAIYVQDLTRPPLLSAELATGLSFALSALAAAIAMPLLGAYADRNDARRLLIASLIALAAALIPQALIPDVLVYLFFRLVVGVALAGTTCAIAVLTRSAAPAGAESRAFGALAAAQNLGWGLGPVVGSTLAAVIGIPGMYLAGAAAALVLVLPLALSPTWYVSRHVAAETEPGMLRASELP